jgi:hypothetical protein
MVQFIRLAEPNVKSGLSGKEVKSSPANAVKLANMPPLAKSEGEGVEMPEAPGLSGSLVATREMLV